MANDLLTGPPPTLQRILDRSPLKGLEPVRKRPVMYIDGTDERRFASPWWAECWTIRMDRRWQGMPTVSR